MWMFEPSCSLTIHSAVHYGDTVDSSDTVSFFLFSKVFLLPTLPPEFFWRTASIFLASCSTCPPHLSIVSILSCTISAASHSITRVSAVALVSSRCWYVFLLLLNAWLEQAGKLWRFLVSITSLELFTHMTTYNFLLILLIAPTSQPRGRRSPNLNETMRGSASS